MSSILPNLPPLTASDSSTISDWLSTPTPTNANAPSIGTKLNDTFGGWLGSNNPVSQGINKLFGSTSTDKASLSWSRVAAFTVGILLIGGGIVMFKQTQYVIQTGVKAGRRAAEIAAL